ESRRLDSPTEDLGRGGAPGLHQRERLGGVRRGEPRGAAARLPGGPRPAEPGPADDSPRNARPGGGGGDRRRWAGGARATIMSQALTSAPRLHAASWWCPDWPRATPCIHGVTHL